MYGIESCCYNKKNKWRQSSPMIDRDASYVPVFFVCVIFKKSDIFFMERSILFILQMHLPNDSTQN